MLRVYWIRFCTKAGDLIAREDYNGLIFVSMEYANKYVFKRTRELEETLGLKLYEDAYIRQIPQIKQINNIAGFVCKYLEQPVEGVLSKLKRREFAYARKFISNICLDLGHTHSTIANETGFDRGSVYAHQKTLKALREGHKEIDAEYISISDQVKKDLSGMYYEDGSGKKLKDENKI